MVDRSTFAYHSGKVASEEPAPGNTSRLRQAYGVSPQADCSAGLSAQTRSIDSELIQKAQITGVQTADVVNAMTHHAKPFHSQTGSKTAPTIGIKA